MPDVDKKSELRSNKFPRVVPTADNAVVDHAEQVNQHSPNREWNGIKDNIEGVQDGGNDVASGLGAKVRDNGEDRLVGDGRRERVIAVKLSVKGNSESLDINSQDGKLKQHPDQRKLSHEQNTVLKLRRWLFRLAASFGLR